MRRLFFLVPLVAVNIFAQTLANQQTAGMDNGRYWAGLNSTGKIHYLRGFSQGLLIAMAESSDYLPNATIAESVKGLDQFYEDPANAAIPITYALKVFKMKVSGATPEKLASEAATYRGLSAAAGELLDK